MALFNSFCDSACKNVVHEPVGENNEVIFGVKRGCGRKELRPYTIYYVHIMRSERTPEVGNAYSRMIFAVQISRRAIRLFSIAVYCIGVDSVNGNDENCNGLRTVDLK